MTDDYPPMLTREQVAKELNVSMSTVGNLLRDGSLFSIRIGKHYRVPREVLVAFKRGEPSPYGRERPEDTADVTTWPPTPSMLAALDGEPEPEDPQAADDRAAVEAAERQAIGRAMTGSA